jgi:DNA/RNA endonuclease YhcR with UshA esterase domain
MKKIILLLILFTGVIWVKAQTIPADSLSSYIGKTVTVCDQVADTHVTKESKVTYLNIGKAYPDQSFTVVIFAADAANFPYTPSVYLKGKSICVTGVAKLYKERPEIIVQQADQIKVQR